MNLPTNLTRLVFFGRNRTIFFHRAERSCSSSFWRMLNFLFRFATTHTWENKKKSIYIYIYILVQLVTDCLDASYARLFPHLAGCVTKLRLNLARFKFVVWVEVDFGLIQRYSSSGSLEGKRAWKQRNTLSNETPGNNRLRKKKIKKQTTKNRNKKLLVYRLDSNKSYRSKDIHYKMTTSENMIS